MKKTISIIAVLCTLCCFTACETEKVDESVKAAELSPSGVLPESATEETEKGSEEKSEEKPDASGSCVSLPVGVVMELDKYEYSYSEESILVDVYYGLTCHVRKRDDYYGEFWLGVHDAKESGKAQESYFELLDTLLPEEMNSCQYCFKVVYGTGKYIYPTGLRVEIPISQLTADEGSITFGLLIGERDAFSLLIEEGDVFSQFAFISVAELSYTKTDTGIKIKKETESGLGGFYYERWEGE